MTPPLSQVAFDELAAISLADHTLATVMERIATLAKKTIPAATEVSVTILERDAATTVAFTGELALHLDESQYERGYGPCIDGIAGGQPVLVKSMREDDRWPSWMARARECGMGSSLSVPVPLQREVAAALNMYSTSEHAFSETDVELGTTFAAYAGVALANMHLYETQARVAEQLQTAMRSRAVIEQAKGILMAQQRCSADAAFNLLVAASQRSNRKLREVAEAIVAQTASRG